MLPASVAGLRFRGPAGDKLVKHSPLVAFFAQDAAQAPGAVPPAGEIGKPEVAEIMGTVLDSGGEIIVFTDQGNYVVTGEDLSDMVGKTVRVLGSLQEDEGRRTINVISVYEIK